MSGVKTFNSVDKLTQLCVTGELQIFQVNSGASDEHDFVVFIAHQPILWFPGAFQLVASTRNPHTRRSCVAGESLLTFCPIIYTTHIDGGESSRLIQDAQSPVPSMAPLNAAGKQRRLCKGCCRDVI